MMQLIGQAIKHKVFGQGVVTDLGDNILTVCFSQGEKKFIYPDAFSGYLMLKNNTMQNEIQGLLSKREAAKETRRQAIQKEQEKEHLIRNLKISSDAQAAFDIKKGQEKEVFSTWSVSTGSYLSGYSKGEPRIPNRIKPNSLCLLTQCEKGLPESNRFILGAFMVQEDFLGSYCRDGIIKAHPRYRLELKADQPPLFWPYIAQEPPVQRWGNVAFKHFPNTTVGDILFDMKELLRDSEAAARAEEFYQYYCKINRLRQKTEDNLPDGDSQPKG